MDEPEMIAIPQGEPVVEIGYDAVAEEVWVRFEHSRLHVYSLVPRVVWEDFVAADSKGRFLREVLEPGYPCRPV